MAFRNADGGGGGGDGWGRGWVLSPEAAVALGRAAIGVVLLLAPGRLVRPALNGPGPSDEAVVALRMFAGRDLAIGLGGFRAASGAASDRRGWLWAGVIADAADLAALARSRSVTPSARAAGMAIAATATAIGLASLRRLS